MTCISLLSFVDRDFICHVHKSLGPDPFGDNRLTKSIKVTSVLIYWTAHPISKWHSKLTWRLKLKCLCSLLAECFCVYFSAQSRFCGVNVFDETTDLSVGLCSVQGFTLNFLFEPNEYFTNPLLTKEYFIRFTVEEDNPLGYEGPDIIRCTGSV